MPRPTVLPSLPEGGVDWTQISAWLTGPNGPDPDDVAEDILEAAGAEGICAAAAVTAVLRITHADGTRARAAQTLAALAAPDDEHAVDLLSGGVRTHRRDAFLGAAYVRALGILALRSDLAQADLNALLLRLRDDDDRFVLMAAAKVAGHLSALGTGDVSNLLTRLVQHPDATVRSEATYQTAYNLLGVALQADDQQAMSTGFVVARTMFETATELEENRVDAEAMAYLLDAMLAFQRLPDDSSSALTDIQHAAEKMEHLLGALRLVDPSGIASPSEQYALVTLAEVMAQLQAMAQTIDRDEHWKTPFGVLVSLAQAYAEVRSDPSDLLSDPRLAAFQQGVSNKVFAATLGTVLRQELTARQLERVRREYQQLHGENATVLSLRALEDAVRVTELPQQLPPQLAQIKALAEQRGLKASDVLDDLAKSLADLDTTRLTQRIGLPSSSPVSQAFLSTLTPSVELVLHKVIGELQAVLEPYPPAQWEAMAKVLSALVAQTRYLRNFMPDFLRIEPKGKGQTAREGDLQDDLRRALHVKFSDQLSDEHRGVAGGRTDLMVTFPEGRFPIEVKHEFRDVSKAHIQQNYLAQADFYATESNQVAFLMILDLRDHTKPHPVTGQRVSLYSLEESFWVQSLEPDPQIAEAKRNGIVIGLVPGNRQHPSDATNYSNAPKGKRKRHS